jgi:hypothetical protein
MLISMYFRCNRHILNFTLIYVFTFIQGLETMNEHFPLCLTIRNIKYKKNKNPLQNYLIPLCLGKCLTKSKRASSHHKKICIQYIDKISNFQSYKGTNNLLSCMSEIFSLERWTWNLNPMPVFYKSLRRRYSLITSFITVIYLWKQRQCMRCIIFWPNLNRPVTNMTIASLCSTGCKDVWVGKHRIIWMYYFRQKFH